MRRCQRLPEVTHPVDPTRPTVCTSRCVPAEMHEKQPKISRSIGRRPWTETGRWTVFWTAVGHTSKPATLPLTSPRADPRVGRLIATTKVSFAINTEGSMRVRLVRSVLAALFLVALAKGSASAQGSFFTSLSGVVVDSSGAVIPGADVKVRNTGTGSEVTTVSGSDGGFTIPSLTGGTYSVTVSLLGFKTAVLNGVTLNAA